MNPWWWLPIGIAAFLTVVTIAIFLFWLIYGPDPDDAEYDQVLAERLKGHNGYREHQ